eukprot:9806802-Heterocapsa_arctica.AAC.1
MLAELAEETAIIEGELKHSWDTADKVHQAEARYAYADGNGQYEKARSERRGRPPERQQRRGRPPERQQRRRPPEGRRCRQQRGRPPESRRRRWHCRPPEYPCIAAAGTAAANFGYHEYRTSNLRLPGGSMQVILPLRPVSGVAAIPYRHPG